MNSTFIFLQIAGPYLAAAAGIGVCVFLFLNGKAGVRRSQRQTELALAEIRQSVKMAEESVAGLRADLQAAEEQFRISAGAPGKSWSNINRRTQALRMLRGGEKPRRIASELGMSAGEVDLILKVNSIASNTFHPENQSRVENESSILSISA